MQADLEEDEALPAAVLAAAKDERVLSALEGLFRRNAHADADAQHPPAPSRCRELAVQAVRMLLDPSTARLADVAGLRFHLALPSAPYPGPAIIHASVWDEDAEVWRFIGEVAVGESRA